MGFIGNVEHWRAYGKAGRHGALLVLSLFWRLLLLLYQSVLAGTTLLPCRSGEKVYNPHDEEVPMPNYDLGILLTLNIGLTMTGILAAMIGVWVIVRQNIHLAGIAERISASTERVAEIAERIDVRLRRQYPDVDNDLR
jgi:hypothetical protein